MAERRAPSKKRLFFVYNQLFAVWVVVAQVGNNLKPLVGVRRES